MAFLKFRILRTNRERNVNTPSSGEQNKLSREASTVECIKVPSNFPPNLIPQPYYFGFTDKSEIELAVHKDGEFAFWGEITSEVLDFRLSYGIRKEESVEVVHLEILTEHVPGENEADRDVTKSTYRLAKCPNGTVDAEVRHASLPALVKYYIGKLYTSPAERPDHLIRNRKLFIGSQIGEGNFCVVTKGRLKRDRATLECAIKEFKEGKREEHDVARMEMLKEASTMRLMKHLNVIRFYGVSSDTPLIRLVMELCVGSLVNHLQQRGKSIEMNELVLYMFEVARGMKYIEHVGVIHRDLAARNMLISRKALIKIADFGLSMLDTDPDVFKAKSRSPIRLMSPETLVKRPKFSNKSDVWAFGMLIWEICTLGCSPWPNEEPKFIAKEIHAVRMPEFPSHVPPELTSFVVTSCWKKDPADRVNFDQAAKYFYTLICGRFIPPLPQNRSISRIPGITLPETEELVLDVTESPQSPQTLPMSSTALQSSKSSTESNSRRGRARHKKKMIIRVRPDNLSVETANNSVNPKLGAAACKSIERDKLSNMSSECTNSKKRKPNRKIKSMESVDGTGRHKKKGKSRVGKKTVLDSLDVKNSMVSVEVPKKSTGKSALAEGKRSMILGENKKSSTLENPRKN